MTNKIKIPKEKIIRAYQSNNEFIFWIGWEMPSRQLPWIITAGTYLKNGKRVFWDVCNKQNAIIVEIKDTYYDKLIIEVNNPQETINLLNEK